MVENFNICNFSPRLSREGQDLTKITLNQITAKKDLKYIQEAAVSPKLDEYNDNRT